MTTSSRMVSKISLARVVGVGVSLCLAGWGLAQTRGSGSENMSSAAPDQRVDWPVYRGDPGGNQYSALAQINATNVHKLTRAWEYHTGDATERSSMYSNPLVIDGLMYFSTPSTKAVALNAVTGEQVWSFDPAVHNEGRVVRLRNRGAAYWKGAEGERIFHFVGDRVYALDAKTGELLKSFGKDGYVDLRQNLGVDPADAVIQMTTPGSVYQNLLILGSRVNESYGSSPGHIRAYDTVTGEMKWIFHTLPRPGEYGHDTWNWPEGESIGGANAWGGVTIDEERGWAFVATGSATDDFYGAFRKGDNLFSNSVVALDAKTGERKWHYQTVHHDIWDFDNPPAPILITINDGNAPRDAVVQLTKMGLTFVLDRDTGEPIFPVEERPVPPSDVPGEQAARTQPYPVLPPPLVRQAITEADLTNISPEAHAYVLKEFRKYRSGSIYTPPSLQGTLTMPGNLGGAQWHGGSFDPLTNVLYVNAHEVPTIHRLRPVYGDSTPGGGPAAAGNAVARGQRIYGTACMACHGADREGRPPQFPTLLNTPLSDDELRQVITEGRTIMPAFPQLSRDELTALVAYIRSDARSIPETGSTATRFSVDGYIELTDQDGYPALQPPWGTLNAINMLNGEILWRVPLGEYPELAAKGIRNTGTLNFGGAVATAGGLVFIAATADEKIRAFEKHTGRVLWEYQLPAGGYATPSVYMVDGKQYVAIAAGGSGKNLTKSGDSIVAFALPQSEPAPFVSQGAAPAEGGWIDLFDGETLNGWVHMNGGHDFYVEDGAIVGRTVPSSARTNSFLCSLQNFSDFELELETYIDPITNSGIQIRTRVREVPGAGPDSPGRSGMPGRINGPQVEIRRHYPGLPTTGVLYGEALTTGWLTSEQKLEQGHDYGIDEGWNKLRIVAKGPRIQTWVNGHLVEDLVNEEVYKTHPSGFIALQVHGLSREVNQPEAVKLGITVNQSLIMKWRNIRIRPLPADE